MRPRSFLLSLALAVAPAVAAPAADAPRTLTVLTYDSFAADWGPGPVIARAFEAECGCTLRIVSSGDAAAILARLRLEGERSRADVVLGLDTALMADALETGLFAPHGLDAPALDLPVPWEDATFLPYDWGWFAFVYDRTRLPAPPASLAELAQSNLKVAIQDPRSSTPGLGLLLWVEAVFGDEAEAYWRALSDNILTVTRGWTESYNLFLDGEADMVLSYTTSPAYHLIEEGDDSKAAAPFAEGHYMQIELAARLRSSAEPELAVAFLRFLLEDTAQEALALGNWMYPARTPATGLPQGYEHLMRPVRSLLMAPEEAQAARAPALEEWRNALSGRGGQ